MLRRLALVLDCHVGPSVDDERTAVDLPQSMKRSTTNARIALVSQPGSEVEPSGTVRHYHGAMSANCPMVTASGHPIWSSASNSVGLGARLPTPSDDEVVIVPTLFLPPRHGEQRGPIELGR
jgi:hypothetical protein